MEQQPLISVAIPAYKSKFLAKAIQSIINQDYKNLEIIIVNDNSPEDIDNVVQQFNDSRINYYTNKKNLGKKDPVANWNKCLSYATGVFFSLLCDDDIYEPTFISSLYKLSLKYPQCNVFRARGKFLNAKGEIIDVYPSAPEIESCIDYMWHRISGLRMQTISEFMYRRKHIVEIGGYTPLPKAWCADDVSIYRFSQNNYIITCNEFLVGFRMSGLNISTTNNKNIREKVEAQNLYTHWIIKILQEDKSNSFMHPLILEKRKNRINGSMSALLAASTWKDFLFLWKMRKTDKYHINTKCFIKSLIIKANNTIKEK